MSDFSLDLRNAEEELDISAAEEGDFGGRVVLGTLDGTTPDEEWLAEIEGGNVLFLAIEGDLNELASGFARDVKENGGSLTHFRRFLVVGPPGVQVDTERL
ncbi:DUF5779 family protein [Halodesulfurarchaeum formicicum]|uniref:Uncharacterized protein n=1 Tax=Halodesulfurarchaeum formicicum TaxID=1873524 RepID=A0A1J1AB50_9EURY|nr:DUF5779 family protein [Halodesulfurarchaeum formicicum]APE95362.1 hypothetical protein HSR6_0909 [Halodesulfurarchaeum formicicum]